MKLALAQLAAVQRDLCHVEQLRTAFAEASARRMQIEPDPKDGFAGLRRRLNALQETAELLAILARHEEAVRALDPRLALEVPAAAEACLR